MARTASSTIFIKAANTTIASNELIQLYYGLGVNLSQRILENTQLTVGDLLTGICIPGNVVPLNENTITVTFGGECFELEEYITIEAVNTPTPTPTPSPTPTSTPRPATDTPTPTPTSPLLGESFGEDYVYFRYNLIDQGRFVWYDTSFTSVTNAQRLLTRLCDLQSNPGQDIYYQVGSSVVDVYANGSVLVNKISLSPTSTAKYYVDTVGNQVVVIVEQTAATYTSLTTTGLYYDFN